MGDPEVHIWPDPYVGKKRLKPITYVIDENGCHVCTSNTSLSNGYPQINRNGRTNTLHHYVCELEKGPIPKGLLVMHSCDNRMCFNPLHLSVGTSQDNMDDMVSKKRSIKGEAVFGAKLLEVEVWAILADPRPIKVIALDHNVGKRMIYFIKEGKFWNHVWREYHGQKPEVTLQLH